MTRSDTDVAEFPMDAHAKAELLSGFPFSNLVVVKQSVFDRINLPFFTSDRFLKPNRSVNVVP